MGAPDEFESALKEREPVPYSDELPSLNMEDLDRVRPEVLLMDRPVDAPSACCEAGMRMIPVSKPPVGDPGIWMVREGCKESAYVGLAPYGDVRCFDALPPQPFALPECVAQTLEDDGYTMEDLRACFMVARLSLFPVLVLTGDTGLLYLTLRRYSEREALQPIVHPNGDIYVGDAWDAQAKTYKRIVKRRQKKMKGLISKPIVKPAAATIVTKADPVEPAVAEAVGAPVNGAVTDAPVEQQQQQQQQQPGVEPVAPVEQDASRPEPQPAQPPETVGVVDDGDEPKKPRARKQPKSVGLDLQKIIDDISADVEPLAADQFDRALDDIRALRDLQIAAARRIANIGFALHKASKNAVEKFEAICSITR